MKGKYYLSDILTPNRLAGNTLNIIKCPTGSGKSYFSLETLPKYVQSNNYILYLTDTNMNKEQIISNFNNTQEYNKYWREFINENTKVKLIPNGWGTYNETYITTMNYAQTGTILSYRHNFDWSKFDYIVCDELHNLINYQNITVNGKSVNNLHYVKNKIEETINNYPNVKVLGLTATPSKVYKEFSNTCNVLNQQEINDLRQYETKKTIYYKDHIKALSTIGKERKGIIYFDRITHLKEIESFLNERGHKTASIWSLSNKDHNMNAKQLQVRQYIIKNQLIPNDIDILLINKACETGVNIKNHNISFMFIHSTESDTITQVRGRLRQDLDLLYNYSPTAINKPNDVPQEYLNRRLTAKEKEYLCVDIIRLLNNKGKPYKWKTVRPYLENNGYKITNTSKSTSIITKI